MLHKRNKKNSSKKTQKQISNKLLAFVNIVIVYKKDDVTIIY